MAITASWSASVIRRAGTHAARGAAAARGTGCCGWATGGEADRLSGKRILRFAAEKALRRALADNPNYESADLRQRGVKRQLDMTRLPVRDEIYDGVIASHVLEHIEDDRLAIREFHRELRAGGIAQLTVPVNGTRQLTCQDASISDPVRKQAHFSAPDHVRCYGLDFTDRLRAAGFIVEIFRKTPAHVQNGPCRQTNRR